MSLRGSYFKGLFPSLEKSREQEGGGGLCSTRHAQGGSNPVTLNKELSTGTPFKSKTVLYQDPTLQQKSRRDIPYTARLQTGFFTGVFVYPE